MIAASEGFGELWRLVAPFSCLTPRASAGGRPEFPQGMPIALAPGSTRFHYPLIVRFDEQKIPYKIHDASADALANLPSRARWFPRKRDVAVPATKRDLSHPSALLGPFIVQRAIDV